MLNYTISLFLIIYFLTFNLIYAGCGSCKVSNKKEIDLKPNIELLDKLDDNGKVKGFVLASCGMCNFGMDRKDGCSLAIMVGESKFKVKGVGIEDYGNSHAEDGFCNAVRVASVVGNVKKNVCFLESFELTKK